jgi:hypothetical protein
MTWAVARTGKEPASPTSAESVSEKRNIGKRTVKGEAVVVH